MQLTPFFAFWLISAHPTFSIPFESVNENGDFDLFDNTLSDSDDPQDYYNPLTLNPTDLFALSPSSSSSSPGSLFSTNDDDDIINDNLDIFSLSDSSLLGKNDNFCPLGKTKRDAAGACDSSTQPPPLPPLSLPDLNSIIKLQDQGPQAIPTTPQSENINPCTVSMRGYPEHACCNGPAGGFGGEEYFSVEDCDPGRYSLWLFSSSFSCYFFSFRYFVFSFVRISQKQNHED